MRKLYIALIGSGSLVVVGLLVLIGWWMHAVPASLNPLTPVVVGEPRPTLPPQPISQTIRGYTLTLVPIYADANRIAFTYTVDGSSGPGPYNVTVGDFNTPAPHLLGRTSRLEFPWRREAGDTRLPGTFDATTRQLVYYPAMLVFAGASDVTSALSLPLHLDLPLRISYDVYTSPEPTAVTPVLIPPTPRPVLQPLLLPFAFDFALPIDPRRRETDPAQTVITRGVQITLEQVVVTASETRLVLRYEPMGDPIYRWDLGAPAGNLLVGTAAIPFGDTRGLYSVEPCAADGRCLYSYTAASLMSQPAAWTLRLDRLLLGGPHQPPSLPGLWEFSFTLPPLNPPATP